MDLEKREKKTLDCQKQMAGEMGNEIHESRRTEKTMEMKEENDRNSHR